MLIKRFRRTATRFSYRFNAKVCNYFNIQFRVGFQKWAQMQGAGGRCPVIAQIGDSGAMLCARSDLEGSGSAVYSVGVLGVAGRCAPSVCCAADGELYLSDYRPTSCPDARWCFSTENIPRFGWNSILLRLIAYYYLLRLFNFCLLNLFIYVVLPYMMVK